MLLISCPYCGQRPEIEFSYAGEAHLARPTHPMALDDEAWAAYLYLRRNQKGMRAERWRHLYGCGRFFNLQRDTISDVIVTSYKVGEPPPDLPATGDA